MHISSGDITLFLCKWIKILQEKQVYFDVDREKSPKLTC